MSCLDKAFERPPLFAKGKRALLHFGQVCCYCRNLSAIKIKHKKFFWLS